MRVRDLGALTVATATSEQPIAGAKATAMLALLSINANQRVSVDALMDAAWGDHLTSGAASTLTSHIWRLRQLLEPGRDRHQPPSVLVNDSDGYRLAASAATLDSLMFAEAASEVRDLLAAGRAERALRRADSALALWRGTPYGPFADAHWAKPSVARLEELRGQLQERRIQALLAGGDVGAALSDLPKLIAAMPFRQSLRVLQLQALYRSGRGDQALQAYQQARQVLIDELGVEPGRELQELHQAILRNDASLTVPARPVPANPVPAEVHLPVALTPLVGRAEVLARLTELLRSQRLVTVVGPAGCGKTRVAIETARAVAAHFPDGVWFVDLTTVSDPDLVPDVIVSTVGFAGSPGATPVQDLRRYLQARRVLLVLDNCEHVLDPIDQVVRAALGDPGLPPECSFLVTSREPVGLDGETIWTLDPLELPDPEETGDVTAPAVELFLQRLVAAVPTIVIDEDVRARAAEIAVALDGLPLPLELAAARALSYSLTDIATQVTADPGRLSRVGRGRNDHRATVRSAIEWSHQLLSPAEQRAHRRLSVLPGPFTPTLAAAVVGNPDDDLEPADVDDLLAQLVHRSMLVADSGLGPYRRSAFRQLATVRSHARHTLAAAGETDDRLDRRDEWATALIAVRPPLGTTAEVDWYRRIDDDYPSVRATLARRLMDKPTAEGGRLAHRLTYYWYHRERLVEANRWLQLGQSTLPDGTTEALLGRIWLSCVQNVQRRLDLARPHLVALPEQVKATPPDRLVEVGEAVVVLALGMYVCEEPVLLGELYELLRWVGDTAADTNLSLLIDAVGCCALLVNGQLEAATASALSVQQRAEVGGNLMADYVSTAPLIVGAMQAGRPAEGLPWIDRCLATHLQLGTGSVGMFIETRANFIAQLGDFEQAARTYSASQAVTRRAGLTWPNRTWTDDLLALTRARLSQVDYERAWHEGEGLKPADIVKAPAGSAPPPASL